jgi:F-type H+-transporting ATPase subunit b
MILMTQFAAADSGLFGVLGIDWKLLLLQIVAFLVLVWLLGKFVYPWLMKSVDARKEAIQSTLEAADEAKQKADKAEKEVAKMLQKAREQAADIVTTAKDEATAAVESAETKARQHAETIVANAQTEIQKNISAAKRELYNETIDLVAAATEKVTVGALAKDGVDEKMVTNAIEGSK